MSAPISEDYSARLGEILEQLPESGLISPGDLARLLPNRPHVSTVWRWCQRGTRGVRLGTVAIGGRRYTSRAMVADFLARLSDRATEGQPRASQRQCDRRESQKARAAARAAVEF